MTFLLFVSFIILYIQALDCNIDVCHLEWPGDSICDVECMYSACDFDSPLSDLNPAMIVQESDCLLICLSFCSLDLLLNQICDPACNLPECGYDLGNCGICSEDCYEYMLGDGTCDEECNTAKCSFDLHDCGWCGSGCIEEMVGDGHCDDRCYNHECQWDSSDCDYQMCAPGCNPLIHGDSFCDEECNVSECSYDEGICFCDHDVCTHELLAESTCNTECNKKECDWHNGKCGDCNAGCFLGMLNNGECNSECMVQDCWYDFPDCGCAPTCFSVENISDQSNYDYCNIDCMDIRCDFNNLPDSRGRSCDDTFIQIASYYAQILNHSYVARFDMEKCMNSDSSCTEAILRKALEDGECEDDRCLTEECVHQFANCYSSQCEDNCSKCTLTGECLECVKNDQIVQFFGICINACPEGFSAKMLSLLDRRVCIRDDATTAVQPKLIYVSSIESEYPGSGSIEDPYTSLYTALTKVSHYHTHILLLEGEHILDIFPTDSVLIKDIFNPLARIYDIKYDQIIIKTALCDEFPDLVGCATERSTIVVDDIVRISANSNRLLIENVKFRGNNLVCRLDQCQDCSLKTCRYCPFVTILGDGNIISDNLEFISEEQYQKYGKNCKEIFNGFNLIEGNEVESIYIKNVKFSNFMTWQDSLISVSNSELMLENVDFEKIHPGHKEKDAVIKLIYTTSELKYYKFSYLGGSVTYLNDGYQINLSISQGGFLHAENVDIIEISNVNFSFNIIQSRDLEESQKSLLYIESSKYLMKFTGLIFYNNYSSASLLSFNNQSISLNRLDAQTPIFRYANLLLSNVSFSKNSSKYGLLKFRNEKYLQNVKLSSVVFDRCISTESEMISFSYAGAITLLESLGGNIRIDSDTLVYADVRFFRIDNLTLFECYSASNILKFRNLLNLTIQNFNIQNSGDHDYTLRDLVIEFTLEDFDQVEFASIKYSSKNSYEIGCDGVIYLEDMHHITLRNGVYRSNRCGTLHSGSSSIIIYRSEDDVRLESILFEDIKLSDPEGGPIKMIEVSKSDIVMTGCTFRNITNSSGAAGIYIIESESILISNLEFYNTTSSDFGAIIIQQASIVKIDSCLFKNVTSTDGYGAAMIIEIKSTRNSDKSVLIQNSSFQTCIAEYGEGCVHLTQTEGKSSLQILLSTLQFKSCRALVGSAVFFSNTLMIETAILDDIQVQSNYNYESGPIHTGHISGLLEIFNCNFEKNSGAVGGISALLIGEDEILTIKNVTIWDNDCSLGGIYLVGLTGLPRVSTYNMKISQNSCPGLVVSSTSLVDSYSIYQGNTIGVYIHTMGNVTMSNAQIVNNVNTEKGGGVLIKADSYFRCSDCIFNRNRAKSGAGIMVEQDSVVSLIRTDISSNIAETSGSALYLIASTDQLSELKYCRIFDNISESGSSIHLVMSQIKVSNSEISDNISYNSTPGFLLNSSKLNITQSIMQNHNAIIGSFIIAQSSSLITVQNSSFLNGITQNNSGAIALFSSRGEITESKFHHLISEMSSAAISVLSDSELFISHCEFYNLTSKSPGSAVYAIDSSLEITNSIFNTYEYVGIYGQDLRFLRVSKSEFRIGFGDYGSAIFCSRCNEIELVSNIFEDNTAIYQGGAVYILADSEDIGRIPYVIYESIFRNNRAEYGGAVYIDGGGLNVSNSEFINNYAAYDGGVACIECIKSQNCNFIISSSRIENNTAQIAGGALYWNSSMPFITSDTLFANNSAKYGNSIGSYPIKMQFLSSSTLLPYSSNSTDSIHPLSCTLSDVPPGQKIPEILHFALVDHYNQIVSSDNSSYAQIFVVNSDTTQLAGTTKVVAVNGIYIFDNIRVSATTGSSVYLQIFTSAVDKNKKVKARDGSEYYENVYVKVDLRYCIVGESDLGMECKVCDKETYSLDPQDSCDKCHEEAYCLGNYTMYPKKGYWRTDVYSDTFYECPNQNACLGSEDYESYTGECETGYRGNMCQPCDNGYSRSNDNKCGKCPEDRLNILRLIGVGIAILVYCAIMVRSSFMSSYKARSLQSIYIKILINYLQLVGIVIGLNLPWPQDLLTFSKFYHDSGNVSTQAFSFDCFLGNSDDDSYIEIYYEKMICMACVPLAGWLLSFIVWSIWALYKKDKSYVQIEMVATIIILFFFIHPTITETYLSIFSCRAIEGEGYFLIINLDIECWKGDHLFYALAVALPCVVVWVIGVPFAVLMYMTKHRRDLSKIKLKLRFGFLYNGYRLKTFYWEFMILYRKLIVIMIMVFLFQFSLNIKALAVLMVLGVSYVHHMLINPYSHHILNELEKRGILVATVTVYCGLYFLADDVNYVAKLVLFVAIMLANGYFLVLWLIYFGHTGWQMLIHRVGFLRRRYFKLDGYESDLITEPRMTTKVYMDQDVKKLTIMNWEMEDDKHIQVELPNNMSDLYWKIVNNEMLNKDIENFSKEEYFTNNWKKDLVSEYSDHDSVYETGERNEADLDGLIS